ncbi:uncharacterized protein LOC110828136 isoform X2 [Zootermopsis nevadensis]|uniref:uncharacterized protein LOC110828136 isoform X2 n=1 Tax=Zootermopsis nevadensis TaxID=136037 RepID=UPI000B8EBFB9|nr:uncharacterized protein LOC110828136 isoform X2 [Zootermopsis nevadensis]
MEDEAGGILFSSNVNNVSHQFSISSVSSPQVLSDDERSKIDPVTAANDLLENGILVETNKGLICLSLKDALISGVGGLNLSVEDFQNVAAQLLTQQNVEKTANDELALPLTLGDVMLSVLPDASQASGSSGNLEIVDNLSSLEVQIELSQDPLKAEEKEQQRINGEKTSIRREETEPRVAVTSSGTLVPEPPPGRVQASVVVSSQQQKKRGGWPKGRKRKPELSEMRPPKAPATGYVLYLNEKRKQYKDLPFPEVTKLLGNEWSKLSLEEKRIYLDRAEVEKRRYREELKAYRQSDAYQSYLNKKRTKNLQGNGTEESDMDATDEIEDEDNEELYCRTCDQWFSSLHNKKEHLYGRQHLQSIAGDFTKERLAAEQDGVLSGTSSHSVPTSLDESSLDGAPMGRGSSKGSGRNRQQDSCCGAGPSNVTDAIVKFMETTTEREHEIKILRRRLKDVQRSNADLLKELDELRERETRLQEDMESEREAETLIQQQLYNLFLVPTTFYITPEVEQDSAETVPVFICLPDGS